MLRAVGKKLVSLYAHYVSAQDCNVVVPFAVNGLLPAAEFRLVHDIVVDKGELVENLQGKGRVQYGFFYLVAEKVIC